MSGDVTVVLIADPVTRMFRANTDTGLGYLAEYRSLTSIQFGLEDSRDQTPTEASLLPECSIHAQSVFLFARRRSQGVSGIGVIDRKG